MSKAIDDLKHEHNAILFALEILEGMNRELATRKSIDVTDVSDFLGFLKEFADKCHHGKEEGFLFPALIKAGLPEQQAPVAVLLAEHVKGREWIRALEAATFPLLRSDEFRTASKGYMDLLQSHIEKENTVLFPIAEKLLTATQLGELYESFENHEATVVGQGRHEQLHALLKGLMEKYSPDRQSGIGPRDEA